MKNEYKNEWIVKEETEEYILYFDKNNPELEYKEYFNGRRDWYKNGSLHRDNGKPAIYFHTEQDK